MKNDFLTDDKPRHGQLRRILITRKPLCCYSHLRGFIYEFILFYYIPQRPRDRKGQVDINVYK